MRVRGCAWSVHLKPRTTFPTAAFGAECVGMRHAAMRSGNGKVMWQRSTHTDMFCCVARASLRGSRMLDSSLVKGDLESRGYSLCRLRCNNRIIWAG